MRSHSERLGYAGGELAKAFTAPKEKKKLPRSPASHGPGKTFLLKQTNNNNNNNNEKKKSTGLSCLPILASRQG